MQNWFFQNKNCVATRWSRPRYWAGSHSLFLNDRLSCTWYFFQGWGPVCVCSYLHSRTDWFPFSFLFCFDCGASPVFDLTADRHSGSIKQSINNRWAFWILASCCENVFLPSPSSTSFLTSFFLASGMNPITLFDSAGSRLLSLQLGHKEGRAWLFVFFLNT